MTSGVVVARIPGSLTTRDIRGVAQDVLKVDVVVLATEGPPFTGSVQVGEIPSGPGAHRGLVCGTCGTSKYKLFSSGGVTLACSTCSGRSSRRHQDRTCRSWNHLGGKEEDFVLRALRPGRRNNRVPERVERAAAELVVADRRRWAELRPLVDAALMFAIADVSLEDALEAP